MSTLIARLFRRGSPRDVPREATRMPRLTPDAPTGTGTGRAVHSSGLQLLELDAWPSRKNALLDGLARVSERAALTGFLGLGITKPRRYQDAAELFARVQLLAPGHRGLIQVFRQKLCEESKGNDSLYVHFAGQPLAHGLLICALSGGGLMAG